MRDTIKKAIRERAYLVPSLFFHLKDAREGKENEVKGAGGLVLSSDIEKVKNPQLIEAE